MRTGAGPVSAYSTDARLTRFLSRALAWIQAALLARFRLQRIAIPVRVVEVVMCLHKVVDREVVLAIIEARSPANNLFELDHGIDRAHQHDIANVSGVHAG
jgi:hypothetical protein